MNTLNYTQMKPDKKQTYSNNVFGANKFKYFRTTEMDVEIKRINKTEN